MTLADDILDAMKKVESSKPRNNQIAFGPSDLGGCREYLRNVIAGAPMEGNDEWPAAAVVGTLLGDYMEKSVAQYMGAQVQVPITTVLPNGLTVTGTADMIFADRNILADCKSKDGFAEIARYGPSLENCIQVSIYTLGCVQNGLLEEGAEAHLIYVDRAGNEQTLREKVLTWEEVVNYVDVLVDRIDSVLEAQEHIDQGEVEWARSLRDKTPPFCFSPKVMCPFRNLCWEGSEWVPNEQITDDSVIEVVHRYVQARADVSDAMDRKEFFRGELTGVSGMTPDGYSVTWTGEGKALYVTKVGK